MMKSIALTVMLLTIPGTTYSQQTSYLLCEYSALPLNGDSDRKIQTIPIQYDEGKLVTVGKPTHCMDKPLFIIRDEIVAWSCVAAFDKDKKPVKSVHIEIHRYTGRYHRNDFDGHYSDQVMTDIWHGKCSVHHEAQF